MKLIEKYQALEQQVLEVLKKKVIDGGGEFTVNIFGYTKLTLRGEELIFLDKHGYEFSLMADCTLLDLIELIDEGEENTLSKEEAIIETIKSLPKHLTFALHPEIGDTVIRKEPLNRLFVNGKLMADKISEPFYDRLWEIYVGREQKEL